MREIDLYEKNPSGIAPDELDAAIRASVADIKRGRVLVIVPDFTRFHSNAGFVSRVVYEELSPRCEVDFLAALGTHVAMTDGELEEMYGGIPHEKFFMHSWREDCVRLGEVSGEFVSNVSDGLVRDPIAVEVNRRLFDGYDAILSIGQVVPHEVVGMANHLKNIFVGCGGSSMINSSHMLGAFYGMERMMGRGDTPVRRVFDHAGELFLAQLPLRFLLTVTTAPDGIITHGFFAGGERKRFENAVALAQKTNMTLVDAPFDKVVVNLDEREFKSTWLGNKSIYRTRMAIADGGELIVLAGGVDKFGEDSEIDALIRKYGYCGRENVIRLCAENEDLRGNLSAAAHLIHGSSDGRFSVTYCTKHLSEDEVRGVCFGYIPYEQAVKKYDPKKLVDGFNTLENGERVYYISNPALGLWADIKKFSEA